MAWVTAYDKAGKAHKVNDKEIEKYKAVGWTMSAPAKASSVSKTANASAQAQAKPQATAAKPAIKIGRK